MRRAEMQRVIRVTALSALLVAGCGGSGDEESSSSATTVTETVPAATSGPALGDYEVVSDVPYADGALLDVYRPTVEGPWPVVVYAHGAGGAGKGPWVGQGFAARGAVAFQVDLADEPPFLETVEQAACAVRYARATAAEHGGDPDNVALVGFSMGAAVGAIVGMSGDDYTTGCVESDTSAVPEVFVGYEGPFDWARGAEDPFELDVLEETDPELWAAIDPYSHIGGHPDLVVRLIHGVDEDEHWWEVVPQVSEDFEQALLAAGYDVELTLIEDAQHTLGWPGSPQFDEILDQTMSALATQ
jgi:acetyl esterase/lipase